MSDNEANRDSIEEGVKKFIDKMCEDYGKMGEELKKSFPTEEEWDKLLDREGYRKIWEEIEKRQRETDANLGLSGK